MYASQSALIKMFSGILVNHSDGYFWLQCEIHELLALVYYDGLQNVVPFYDQRYIVPSKDAAWMIFCENSLKHFKKAFVHKYIFLFSRSILFSFFFFFCSYDV